MNNDLIKELEVLLDYYRGCPTGSLFTTFTKCKAEIERLVIWPSELLDKIERLSKPYVPMTIFECYDVAASYNAESEHLSLVAHIEAAVIARYNEQRGVK